MITVPDVKREKPSLDEIAALKARCKALHLTHDRIAARHGCHRVAVVNLFAGRMWSWPLWDRAVAMCERAERRKARSVVGAA